MSEHMTMTLMKILAVCGSIFAVYGVYNVFVALFGFKKSIIDSPAKSKTKFAVIVAARNEAAVIGQLVDSLMNQNYPKDKYEIFVAPNNCTDETEQVALKHGATIFKHSGEVKGKGEILSQITNKLMQAGKFDAICVFDADNLAHPDFLQKMNDAYVGGVRVGQGFRNSKNPSDSAVATSYSVCYWMLSRFYNGSRRTLGLSGLVNGSGFMVALSVLRKIGGWKTETLTEDFEFSAQCVLAGERVQYVQQAVIYDEQPLTFMQSWKQRRRWSSGSVQSMRLYLPKLLADGFKNKSAACIDMAITFMMPLIQLASTVIGGMTMILGAYGIFKYSIYSLKDVLILALIAAVIAFTACACVAAFIIYLNRGEAVEGMGKGVIYFAWFLLSWLPIGLISIFKETKTWEPIVHSKAVTLSQIISS